ncbi:SRPBCC family protein [Spirillospora sp. NPDC052269]
MYEFTEETVIDGNLATVWATAIDVDTWPDWDPHEEAARLNGPFTEGGTGWSKPRGGPATTWTITDVVPLGLWASECDLPGGKITGVNTFEETAEGVRCTKTVRVTGPLTPLFRFHFGRRMRRDFFKTWTALEAEAARRNNA